MNTGDKSIVRFSMMLATKAATARPEARIRKDHVRITEEY
jgi:hypothetical protein